MAGQGALTGEFTEKAGGKTPVAKAVPDQKPSKDATDEAELSFLQNFVGGLPQIFLDMGWSDLSEIFQKLMPAILQVLGIVEKLPPSPIQVMKTIGEESDVIGVEIQDIHNSDLPSAEKKALLEDKKAKLDQLLGKAKALRGLSDLSPDNDDDPLPSDQGRTASILGPGIETSIGMGEAFAMAAAGEDQGPTPSYEPGPPDAGESSAVKLGGQILST